jgi:hypothetical protein
MDPYLERYWGDVHERLVMYSCDQLQPALPPDLRARVSSRVFVESATEADRHVYPDIHVVERRTRGTKGGPPSGGSKAVLAEPLLVDVGDEPTSQSFLEIIDVGSGHRIITVIDFLSPTNKSPGEGRDLYLRKQTETRDARVSLVEVDLTRAGKRVLMLPPHRIPPSHRTTYQACVRRGWKRSTIEVYRIPLEERLPVIPIPLRESDPDAALDLQPVLDQAYANGRYDDIDYRAEPDPPLEPADAAWASSLLRSAGLR